MTEEEKKEAGQRVIVSLPWPVPILGPSVHECILTYQPKYACTVREQMDMHVYAYNVMYVLMFLIIILPRVALAPYKFHVDEGLLLSGLTERVRDIRVGAGHGTALHSCWSVCLHANRVLHICIQCATCGLPAT